MKETKCGIYQIQCTVSNKIYVGSSSRIHQRWAEHRRQLRLSIHRSPRLQRAWVKHGEVNFHFSVLEECERDVLFVREQHYIDQLKPDYNAMLKVTVISREMRSKITASLRARAALITHCPHGHEYTPENTGRNGRGRICRTCGNDRVRLALAAETPEQRELRRNQAADLYEKNRVEQGRSDRWSAEHRARISQGLMGRDVSEETRQKLSEVGKAIPRERMEKMWAAARLRIAEVGGPRKGQPVSLETREKIRATLKQKITHCLKGHPFDEANTLIERKTGKRMCRACRKEVKRRYRERQAA